MPRRAALRSRRQKRSRQTLLLSTPTDSGPATKPTGKTAPPDVTHRVPSGYSKLGLTDQQKEKLYKIQAEYYPKIQALEKQVDALREKREKEFESVLTAPQKRLLAEAAAEEGGR